MTIQALKNNAVKIFTDCGFSTPQLDADCLLQFFLNKDKTWVLLHRDEKLTSDQQNKFNALVEKRKTGLPIAYITGKKEFYGIEYFVTPDVLIPKPDTEILIETAVNKILDLKKETVKIIDVCTGSGCVGLSVLKELLDKNCNSKIELTLTDISTAALKVAEKNAKNIFGDKLIGAEIKLLNGDLLCKTSGYDFILSNPPYVPHSEVEELLKDGRSEPRLALDGDTDTALNDGLHSADDVQTDDGLPIIRRLVPVAYEALNSGGSFIMESGEYQTETVRRLFTDVGFINVISEKDLSGMERITIGDKK